MSDVGAQAVALARELVGIDSVNPGLVPGAAGEREIVEHLRQRLARSGFDTTVVGLPERPSLVAIPAAVDGPTVVLNGHLDTVGVEGMPEPFAARIDHDRLHGRGAADMKGGVAALVVAAEQLVAARTSVRPVLALVADEEDASLGSEAVIAALPDLGIRPDACLIAEPTDLAIARSLRGFSVARVSIRGRAAHSSQPELGVNAVTRLGALLHAIEQRAASIREDGGDLTVTMATGGRSAFVIPDHAEALVERRSSPTEGGVDLLAELRDLLPATWDADVEIVAHRDAWQLDQDGPAADLAAALGHELGTGPTLDAPYWMEAPLWQFLAPTVICGPSGGGLHAVDEWVDLGQVRRLTPGLVDVLAAWSPHAD